MRHLTRQDIEDRRSRGFEEANLYSSPSKSRIARANEIIDEISTAFSDVELHNGIGLFEGYEIDNYGTDLQRGQARAKDEKHDWRKITPDDLNLCNSSLSFFDPHGMRFHLPAFICADLKGEFEMHLEFHLTKLSERKLNQFSHLKPHHKAAVATYLDLFKDDIDAEGSRHEIEKALTGFWRPPAN